MFNRRFTRYSKCSSTSGIWCSFIFWVIYRHSIVNYLVLFSIEIECYYYERNFVFEEQSTTHYYGMLLLYLCFVMIVYASGFFIFLFVVSFFFFTRLSSPLLVSYFFRFARFFFHPIVLVFEQMQHQ